MLLKRGYVYGVLLAARGACMLGTHHACDPTLWPIHARSQVLRATSLVDTAGLGLVVKGGDSDTLHHAAWLTKKAQVPTPTPFGGTVQGIRC